MARRMPGMIHRELRNAVVKIGDANLLRALLQNMIETAEIKRREILAIGIAWAVLDRTRYTNHALDARIIRSDLRVGYRPIHVVTVKRGGTKIDVAKPGRGSSPEVGFSADGPTARPGPDGSRSRCVSDFVFPHTLHPFIVHETN